MASPRPKPTALRILGGKAGHRPLNKNEPKPPIGATEAPDLLNAPAREEWDRVCGILIATGILTLVDRGILTAYCQAFGRAVVAEETIRIMGAKDEITHGLLIKSAKGNTIPNPMVGIANVAWRDMLRYAIEMGMTPSARSRIRAIDAVSESDNPFIVLKNG